MAGLLFILFVVVPIAELYVIVQVAGLIGVLETIGLLIAVALLGSWLMKQQGTVAWKRFRRSMEEGRIPTEEISDGALIMFGGALLLTPGFLTDILGFALLFPPSRAVVKAAARRGIKRWVQRRTGAPPVSDARVVRVEREATGTTPPASDPSGKRLGALEDDSRDTP